MDQVKNYVISLYPAMTSCKILFDPKVMMHQRFAKRRNMDLMIK